MSNDLITPNIAASLYWTAIGDALGLPYEGLTPQRAQKLLGPPTRYRLLAGKGMVSDDTEHALLTAEALARTGGEVTAFERELASLLRGWFVSLPAGIGWATLRSGIKLSLGVPAAKSGVYSAGNGPMMRSAVIGACGPDLPQVAALVRVSTRLTHTDPKAEYAALAVALAAWCEAHGAKADFLSQLQKLLPPDAAATELLELLDKATQAHWQPHPKGVSGYAYHTAPAVIAAWWHAGEPLQAVQQIITWGGDTDTTAAILGGILGAAGQRPPDKWLAGISERALGQVPTLGQRVSDAVQSGKLSRAGLGFGPKRWPRNALFAGVVIAHGLRRMLPPY